MESTYTELYFGDLVDQISEVRISNAPANEFLKVFIRGVSIGAIVTDENGFGRLTKTRLGVPLDDQGRPDAPRIETDTPIRVSGRHGTPSISGTFMPL